MFADKIDSITFGANVHTRLKFNLKILILFDCNHEMIFCTFSVLNKHFKSDFYRKREIKYLVCLVCFHVMLMLCYSYLIKIRCCYTLVPRVKLERLFFYNQLPFCFV